MLNELLGFTTPYGRWEDFSETIGIFGVFIVRFWRFILRVLNEIEKVYEFFLDSIFMLFPKLVDRSLRFGFGDTISWTWKSNIKNFWAVKMGTRNFPRRLSAICLFISMNNLRVSEQQNLIHPILKMFL